jgi:hypothetical protein
MQAADLPESPLAAAAALPCGRSCWLPGWCTRVLRQVWQAKECASTLARYCACQLVCVCRSLIAAFRCAGVISFSKPFLASLKVASPARGPLEQARLNPPIRINDAAADISLKENMSQIEPSKMFKLCLSCGRQQGRRPKPTPLLRSVAEAMVGLRLLRCARVGRSIPRAASLHAIGGGLGCGLVAGEGRAGEG